MSDPTPTTPDDVRRFAAALTEIGQALPAAPPLGETSTCRVAVSAVLLGHLAQLVEQFGVLLGVLPSAGDVERVHQARVAARRLRTDLRTFRPLLDGGEVGAAGEGLRWLVSTIGALRDHDVFAGVLAEHAARHPDEPSLVRLVEHVSASHHDRLLAMQAGITGAQTLDVLGRVAAIAVNPPLGDHHDEQAGPALTSLARRPWRKLARAARQVDDASPVEALHELRLKVKRARYAIEAVSLVRPSAREHARALARLQTTLGELADAALTIRMVRAELPRLDREATFAAGLVVAFEKQHIDDRRADWSARWDAARRRKLRTWMTADDGG